MRSGAVLDLRITPNTVTALVSGCRSKPYMVKIGIESIGKDLQPLLTKKSRVSLHWMHDLLAGRFPEELKVDFFKKDGELFPSPKEITLNCSCPDWADMCKHVEAALYGVGARLDRKPELFFVLRGIDVEHFVSKAVKRESERTLRKARAKSERVIAADDADVAAMFGIEMDRRSPSRPPTNAAKTAKKKDGPSKAR